MAEEATEPEVPVEEPVEEAAAAEGAAEEDQATSSSAPKERVKRLPRPDDAELKAQTGSLNDKIQQAKARVEEIKELINSKSGNRGGSAEQQAVKGKLSDLRNQFQQELVSWACLLLSYRLAFLHFAYALCLAIAQGLLTPKPCPPCFHLISLGGGCRKKSSGSARSWTATGLCASSSPSSRGR